MTNIIEPGDIFGNLTAVSCAGKNKHGNMTWVFNCQCGNTITVPSWPVTNGRHKSCGCLSTRKRQNGTFVAQPDLGATKNCSTCNQDKNLDQFRLDRRSPIPGKRHARCNQCERLRVKTRVHNDPSLRLRNSIRALVRYSLKEGKGGESTWKYLPYTRENLVHHLESLFEPWMNWNNYGTPDYNLWDDNDSATWKWQIDHIIPIDSFNYTRMDCKEFKECWALSNLRPLSAKENVRKGSKLLP